MAAKCSDAAFEIGFTFGVLVHEIINVSQYREACSWTTAYRGGGKLTGVTLYYFTSSNYW